MKNKIIILGLAIVATTMFSCKKEYTCKCEKVYTTNNGTTTKDDGSYTFKDNKAKAGDKCNDQEGTGSDLSGDYTRECDIQ